MGVECLFISTFTPLVWIYEVLDSLTLRGESSFACIYITPLKCSPTTAYGISVC